MDDFRVPSPEEVASSLPEIAQKAKKEGVKFHFECAQNRTGEAPNNMARRFSSSATVSSFSIEHGNCMKLDAQKQEKAQREAQMQEKAWLQEAQMQEKAWLEDKVQVLSIRLKALEAFYSQSCSRPGRILDQKLQLNGSNQAMAHVKSSSCLRTSTPITGLLTKTASHMVMLILACYFLSVGMNSWNYINEVTHEYTMYKFTAVRLRNGDFPTSPNIHSFGLLRRGSRTDQYEAELHVQNESIILDFTGSDLKGRLNVYGGVAEVIPPNRMDGFFVITSNESNEFDPVSFALQGSHDGVQWDVIACSSYLRSSEGRLLCRPDTWYPTPTERETAFVLDIRPHYHWIMIKLVLPLWDSASLLLVTCLASLQRAQQARRHARGATLISALIHMAACAIAMHTTGHWALLWTCWLVVAARLCLTLSFLLDWLSPCFMAQVLILVHLVQEETYDNDNGCLFAQTLFCVCVCVLLMLTAQYRWTLDECKQLVQPDMDVYRKLWEELLEDPSNLECLHKIDCLIQSMRKPAGLEENVGLWCFSCSNLRQYNRARKKEASTTEHRWTTTSLWAAAESFDDEYAGPMSPVRGIYSPVLPLRATHLGRSSSFSRTTSSSSSASQPPPCSSPLTFDNFFETKSLDTITLGRNGWENSLQTPSSSDSDSRPTFVPAHRHIVPMSRNFDIPRRCSSGPPLFEDLVVNKKPSSPLLIPSGGGGAEDLHVLENLPSCPLPLQPQTLRERRLFQQRFMGLDPSTDDAASASITDRHLSSGSFKVSKSRWVTSMSFSMSGVSCEDIVSVDSVPLSRHDPDSFLSCSVPSGGSPGKQEEDHQLIPTFEPQVRFLVGQKDRDRPVLSLDQLYTQAVGMKGELRLKVQGLCLETGGSLPVRPNLDKSSACVPMRWEDIAKEELIHSVHWTRLKNPTRAIEKLFRSYKGDVSRLLDICRQCIIFDTPQEILDCLRAIFEDKEIIVERIKNRLTPNYDDGISAGYRDVLVNLRIDSFSTRRLGIELHICELQLVLKSYYALKSVEGHSRYVAFRNGRGE